MSEIIKRYTFMACDNVEDANGKYILASDYDKLAAEKEGLDKLCEAMAVKDGKQFAVMQKLAAELAELKAKSSGVDERAAFEAAYLKANYPRVAAGELSAPPIFGRVGSMRFHGQAEGDYECSDVHKCWVIWQARARLNAAPVQQVSVPDVLREAIKWADHLCFECGALVQTRAPSVHVYNKTFEAVQAAKAMLAAAPSKEGEV